MAETSGAPNFSVVRTVTKSGCRFNTPEWEAAWAKLPHTGLTAMSLVGHGQTLFKTHMLFKTAKNFMDAPQMSPTFSLKSVADCNMTRLYKRWKVRECSLIQGIYSLNYGVEGGELDIEAPYVQ